MAIKLRKKVAPIDAPDKLRTQYLTFLCYRGWKWREIKKRARRIAERDGQSFDEVYLRYKRRLDQEITAFEKQKFIDYVLVVYDLYRWARRQKIWVGPGRGSAAGSLVLYLIGVTAIDPMEHNLLFERFINPDRIDMPDVDMDFEDDRREEVIEYLFKHYGRDKVAMISTVGTMKGKQCLRDICRVLGIDHLEIEPVLKSIVERSSGDERASQTIEDAFIEFEVGRLFNARHPEVLPLAKRLEGHARQLGVHAAGLVLSPVPIDQIVPIEMRKRSVTLRGKTTEEMVPTTALEMWGAQSQGLLKFDILGLRTMTILKEACQAIGQIKGEDIDLDYLERLPLNDEKVLEGFTNQDFVGIFQYDSTGARAACEGLKFDAFEDVPALTALNRPGCMRSGLATQYSERKKDPSKIKPVHPAVDRILASTKGVIVYQEQVNQIFIEVAGYAPGTADSLRKAIAKKYGDETLGKEREQFIAGAKARGVPEKAAEKLMNAITFFGCLDRDTLIATPDGKAKAMRNLKAGDEVLSRRRDGATTPNRIKAIGATGYKQVKRILVGESRHFTATDEHWFLLESNKYRQVKNLKIGDMLVVNGAGSLPVTMIVPWGGALTMDMEMESYPHNYVLLSGLTSHNSYGFNKCLAGDTLLHRAGKLPTITVQQLHKAWNSCTSWGKKLREHGLQLLQLHTDRKIRSGRCVGVHMQADLGILYEIITESGRTVKATANHRFMTPNGYLCVRDMSPNTTYLICCDEHEEGCPSEWDLVISIKESPGLHCVYDVEMEDPHHNFIANGIVSHNSHAAAYGTIAYWGMWLKTYYPLEFYLGLMRCEPDRSELSKVIKDARKHNIEVKPPHVNSSKTNFVFDPNDGVVRCSLADIKGVGEKGVSSIVEAQPFSDFPDFLARVQRRSVHKGVIAALIKAGALDQLIPNRSLALENLDDLITAASSSTKRTKKQSSIPPFQAMYDDMKSRPDWPKDEMDAISSSVLPLYTGRHPMEVYDKLFRKRLRRPWTTTDKGIYDEESHDVWIRGIVVDLRYNCVGDFHSGALPEEEERKKMNWGARYANLNIEDESGENARVKVDWDIFDTFRHIVDKGKGTPVVAHVAVSPRWHSVRAHYMADLFELSSKIRNGQELTWYERCFVGSNPDIPDIDSSTPNRDEFKVTGMICNVKFKMDKNMNMMAWFGLQLLEEFIEVVVFASVLSSGAIRRKDLKSGNIVRVALQRSKDGSLFLSDRRTSKVLGSV